MNSCVRGVALIGLLLGGCSTTIDGPRARALVQDEQAVLLDVRSVEEFESGHIGGALNVPVDTLEARLTELEIHRKRTIIVYCQSGFRSARAEKILSASGFRARNLGGMDRW